MRALAISAVCLVILVLLGLGLWAWTSWSQHGAVKQLAHAEQAAGDATVAAGQARAETDAGRIVAAGQARTRLDIEVHQSNAQAIESAPGAGVRADPALLDAARRGLCRHPSYRDDPDCRGLLQADPAVVPPAGAAGSAD